MRSKPERNQIITKEEKVGCGTTDRTKSPGPRNVGFVGAHRAIAELNRRVKESIRKRHNIGDSTNSY